MTGSAAAPELPSFVVLPFCFGHFQPAWPSLLASLQPAWPLFCQSFASLAYTFGQSFGQPGHLLVFGLKLDLLWGRMLKARTADLVSMPSSHSLARQNRPLWAHSIITIVYKYGRIDPPSERLPGRIDPLSNIFQTELTTQ